MQIGIRALDDNLNLQKKQNPLIHCITTSFKEIEESIINYCGKPIFSDSIEEYAKLTLKAYSLLITLNDLNEDKIDSIEQSIRLARRKRIPIVLDILGVNISFTIKEIALRFINRYNINVIVGRIEEFKLLVFDNRSLNKEKNIEYKLIEDIKLRISLRRFAKLSGSIIIVKDCDYYLTDGFSEFYIKREIINNKLIDSKAIISGLISVGIASASNTEEGFLSVLVAIMTMAVSEKKAEQKNLIYSEDINLIKYLEDEIKNINSDELNKLSKVDYLFIR